jgi:WD40 repeat protein
MFRKPLPAWGGAWVFTPDDRVAAVATRDGTVKVIDARSGKLLHQFGEPLADGTDVPDRVVALSPDGALVAAWEPRRQEIHLWNLATGRRTLRLSAPAEVRGQEVILAWSPDGRTLAVAGLDDTPTVRLLEAATGKERRRWTGHELPILCLAFSPNGRLLASGSEDTTVLVWEVLGTMP